MIRFIHTADIHFGVENYGRMDPKTGIHSRLNDFKKSFDSCISYAIKNKVDLFIFSGDAYKTTNPNPTQQRLLFHSFMQLYKANIPVIITVGNHDNPLSFGKANSLDIFDQLPIDGFHLFSKPGKKIIQTQSGPVQIVGIPWPNRHNLVLNHSKYAQSIPELTKEISSSLAKIIKELASQLDPNIPAILSGHLTVTSGSFSGSEKKAIYGQDPTLMPSQLAIKPFDYVALGHLHKFQNLNKDGKIPVVYSGSIDRVDFGERKEEKGFCDVSIKSKYDIDLKFIKIKTRPFIQINIDLIENEDQTSQIIKEIRKRDIKGAILKIIYTVPESEIDNVNSKKVIQNCYDAIYIVNIIPIKTIKTRSQRNILKQGMTLETLLKTYFNSQENLKKRAAHLTKKALKLEELLEQKDNE